MFLNNIFNYSVQKKFSFFLFNIINKLVKQIHIKNQFIEIKTNSKYVYTLSLFFKKHTHCQYKTLSDLVTYDCPGNSFRFALVYNLLSVDYNSRILISTQLTEYLPVVTTLVPLYSGAA
jgi:NADH:ubiquinone oxidoreductase subunit C